jgi:hypothetical protein
MSPFFKWPLFFFFTITAFVLVFVPIDDRGADEWFVNFVRSLLGVNERTWQKNPKIPKALSMESIKFIQAGWIATTTTTNRRKVEEFIGRISQAEFVYDDNDYNFKERSYIEKPINNASLIEEEYLKKLPSKELESPTTAEVINSVEPKKESAFEEVVLINPFIEKEEENKKVEIKISKIIPSEPEITSKQSTSKKVEEVDLDDGLRTSNPSYPGRKFVSFSQKEAEELILPIKGERSVNIFQDTPVSVPKVSEKDLFPQKDIKEIANELKKITEEVKKEYDLVQPKEEVKIIDGIVPNTINGTVTNDQDQVLPKLILELSKRDGTMSLRTETDALGNFNFFTSSLGEMQIKITNPQLYGLKFDIINFEIKEYPFHPFKIVGRK